MNAFGRIMAKDFPFGSQEIMSAYSLLASTFISCGWIEWEFMRRHKNTGKTYTGFDSRTDTIAIRCECPNQNLRTTDLQRKRNGLLPPASRIYLGEYELLDRLFRPLFRRTLLGGRYEAGESIRRSELGACARFLLDWSLFEALIGRIAHGRVIIASFHLLRDALERRGVGGVHDVGLPLTGGDVLFGCVCRCERNAFYLPATLMRQTKECFVEGGCGTATTSISDGKKNLEEPTAIFV